MRVRVEELRIGNWVEFGNGKITQVGDILSRTIHSKDRKYIIDVNYAKPITLTEDWLLKFGFVENPYQDRYEKGSFIIDCNKTRGRLELYEVVSDVELKYVHSLQNLYFSLTGEELTIKP